MLIYRRRDGWLDGRIVGVDRLSYVVRWGRSKAPVEFTRQQRVPGHALATLGDHGTGAGSMAGARLWQASPILWAAH